jgi:predicted ABC-type ATPase
VTTPVLHVLAGPNGSGKSTFAEILVARTHLPLVNADLIAADLWPGDLAQQVRRGREVSVLAMEQRERLMAERSSYVTETVFSHVSKLELVRQAQANGYTVALHVMLVPADLAVARVADRVAAGGHKVPATKIRSRYRRLWALVAQARDLADRADFYDNSRLDQPFRRVATYEYGQPVGTPEWPAWTPPALR